MEIANIAKKEKFDVWGARWGKYPNFKHLLNTEYPDKGWLGNPYVIGPDGTRDEVIAKYKIDFYKKISTNLNFKSGILSLKDKTVACFCSPDNCHLNIIQDYINQIS